MRNIRVVRSSSFSQLFYFHAAATNRKIQFQLKNDIFCESSCNFTIFISFEWRSTPERGTAITTTTRYRSHCWLLDSWQVSFLITRVHFHLQFMQRRMCGRMKTMPSKSCFGFLRKKNHDFDPHNWTLLTNWIRCRIVRFSSNAIGALWAHAISVHVRCHTRISCSMVIYGCFAAVFLFGFNCFFMIRCGIICLMAYALSFVNKTKQKVYAIDHHPDETVRVAHMKWPWPSCAESIGRSTLPNC